MRQNPDVVAKVKKINKIRVEKAKHWLQTEKRL